MSFGHIQTRLPPLPKGNLKRCDWRPNEIIISSIEQNSRAPARVISAGKSALFLLILLSLQHLV
jgi:hypothetical protein